MVLPEVAAAAAGQVSITIEEVERIARSTMSQMESEAQESSQPFRDLRIGGGAYGGVPLAQQFGQQHDAAHAVFMDTINAVLSDLTTFRDNLLACAHAHESNDEAVESTFAAMSARYRGHEFRSDDAFRSGRGDRRLDVPGAADGQGSDQAGPSEDSAASAASAASADTAGASGGNAYGGGAGS